MKKRKKEVRDRQVREVLEQYGAIVSKTNYYPCCQRVVKFEDGSYGIIQNRLSDDKTDIIDPADRIFEGLSIEKLRHIWDSKRTNRYTDFKNIDIDDVISQINNLFKSYDRDSHSFTVDYDETTHGIYCHYTPYPNDNGYSITDDLLIVDLTSKNALQKLQNFLDKNNISSRNEWSVSWGKSEN